jgi:hypothetical protein
MKNLNFDDDKENLEADEPCTIKYMKFKHGSTHKLSELQREDSITFESTLAINDSDDYFTNGDEAKAIIDSLLSKSSYFKS